MTDLRQAAQQALEALEDERYVTKYTHIVDAINALRTALEQPEQEPVAWRYQRVSPFKDKEGMYKVSSAWTLINKPNQRDAHSAVCGMEAEPLYTTPPAAQPEHWDKPSASFNEWWDSDSDSKADSVREMLFALQDRIDALEAQRQPLTIAEVEQILAQHRYELHGDRARYIVRMTEEAHNIKEGI